MFQSIPTLWLLAPISALIALFTAKILHSKVMKESEGTARMIEIAGYVKEGAMAYLKRQYRVVAIVFAILFTLLLIMAYFGVQSKDVNATFEKKKCDKIESQRKLGRFLK